MRCDPSSGCPGAQVCDNGFCRAPGVSCGGDGGIVIDDAPIDQGTNVDGLYCYGRGEPPFTSVCYAEPPTAALNLPSTIDTTSCDQVLAQNGGPELCVIAGGVIQVADLDAIGPRVLLLLATDTLVVQGRISVAGSLVGTLGTAPAGSSICIANSGDTGGGQLGGGGGAGGSAGAVGGPGGTGESQTTSAPPGLLSPFVVQGGCSGGLGGPSINGPVANGGAGGGAIYLMAGNAIRVNGIIDASGAGGNGAGLNGGGGGGGAGGSIVLDAATITIDPVAQIFALGGGGGGGGSNTTGGKTGGDPTSPTAPGAAGAGAGAAGGTGGVANGGAGGNASPGTGNGGGGGGGGGGLIHFSPTISTSTNVSPTPR